ncbi:MAG: hypothetical protein H7Y86_16760 [Rhizobacter sp.]|nr:hypothetical protein [Ferruginibacter sp.]
MTTTMQYRKLKTAMLMALTAVTILTTSCEKDDDDDYTNPPPALPASTILRASGDSLGIVATVNLFRGVLGDVLNTTPNQTSGRREVNWDGVPSTLTNNNLFPLDFFNLTDPAGANGRKRGLVYVNTGSPLRLDSSNFTELSATHADEFIPFTKKKTIVSANSTVSEIIFKVPGTDTSASVKGFGIIFSDVDDAASTSLEFFNGTKSLGVYKPLARTVAGGFSFLGVHFTVEKITKIKITAGSGVFAAGVKDISDGGNKDLVVYDDFLYSEPQKL